MSIENINEICCSICCDTINNPVVLTRCGHSFCKSCLIKWISNHSTCPLCKGPVQAPSSSNYPVYINNYILSSNYNNNNNDIEKIETAPISTNNNIQKYDIKTNTCPICHNILDTPCITCEHEKDNKECVLVTGKCSHIYHYHCIKKWLIVKPLCPMDDYLWEIDVNKTNIHILPSTIIIKYYNSEIRFDDLSNSDTIESIKTRLENIVHTEIIGFVFNNKQQLNLNQTLNSIKLQYNSIPTLHPIFKK